MIFTVLLVALLPVHAWTYKILMVPLVGNSHVFSMVAMAEGLINRGHKVTIYIAENFRLNIPELRNRTELSVVRYIDAEDGAHIDYDALQEYVTKLSIESRGNIQLLASVGGKAYADFSHIELLNRNRR